MSYFEKVLIKSIDRVGKLSICIVSYYLIFDDEKGDSFDNRIKIDKLINNSQIKKLTPEEIFLLQFNEENRERYKSYITYPGTIMNCVLSPLSITSIFGGMLIQNIKLFAFGYGLMYLICESNIINNGISNDLNKKNLIIDENDFISLRVIRHLVA